MERFINISRHPEGEGSGGYTTQAVITVGTAFYLYKENAQGQVRLDYIDPSANRLAYMSETRDLDERHFHTFDNVNAARTSMIALPSLPPVVGWHEGAGVREEATFRFNASLATKGDSTDFVLEEAALVDLLLKNVGDPTKRASFFTADTRAHEIIGIALKRQYPELVFIRPALEGTEFSPKQGLITLLDSIYSGLLERLTPLQWEVDQAVFDAFGPDGAMKLPAAGANPAQRRHTELLKKIYQLKALLLAAQAENNGNGIKDPALLAHAPFLNGNGHKAPARASGMLRRIFVEDAPVAVPKTDFPTNIWSLILAQPNGELIRTENTLYTPWSSQDAARTTSPIARPAQPAVARPVAPARPAPVPQPQVARTSVAAETRRTLQFTEKQKVMLASRDLAHAVDLATRVFANVPADALAYGHIEQFNEVHAQARLIAQQFLHEYRPDQPLKNPTSTIIEPRDGAFNVAGMHKRSAGGFLTGYKPTEWNQKIEASFAAWNQHAVHLFKDAPDRFNRSLRALQKPGTVRTAAPATADIIYRDLRIALNGTADEQHILNVDAAVASHLLLSSQTLFALAEHYKNLLRNGDALDLKHWASVTLSLLGRLQQLPTIAPKG